MCTEHNSLLIKIECLNEETGGFYVYRDNRNGTIAIPRNSSNCFL
jgi:hypothetical protein